MGDLTTDAVPMGTQTNQNFDELRRRNLQRAQQVYNITGSTGVHIGTVVHNVVPRKRPRVTPQDLPLQKEVDALRRCKREINEQDKFVVSEHLGSVWRSMARLMGFSPGQVDNLEADYPRSVDRVYELLTCWHDRDAHDATIDKLTDVLLAVKAYHVVKRLKP
nr:receptor-interacting serine/threonine-protein kinase 1-like [Cherax quadricarinatus]XP_053645720.1 receptor-interacting serine/threonine-protein kinase 1-like [Cherax quadricarinatus]XP_053645721.1 receptor-interacting serine/threonine-protein kinase 1-like [Cherax quadricarinatus]XP_053645722.1 receptor-interacting serine/threonine-protein kinase 1-like [Cherax quadricarinatus]XP_053645723.1 receptor-interacting serine/threonine-protein kinase 1-like [Cherax quadricarinatus]